MIDKTRSIMMRHEEKYICSEARLKILESRLKGFLSLDQNQKEEGYEIRSLYFDTASDRLFEEGLAGVENRDKYRIRIYNGSTDVIKLEKKTSIRNLKKKNTQLLTHEYVKGLLAGEGATMVLDYESDSLLREFTMLQNAELLSPKCIINYNRKAFVSDIGNVRITLDRNICVSDAVEDFLLEDTRLFPILPPDVHVLEVKYDGILPGYLVRLLNFDDLERTSFSKYVLGRDVIKNNGRMRGLYEF